MKFRNLSLGLFLLLCVNLGYANFEVKVIYFKTRHAENIDSDKYQKIFRKIQLFFRDEMVRHGYGEKTIKYEMDGDRVKVHTITGKHDGEYYSGDIFDVVPNKIQHEIPFEINSTTNLQARQHHYILLLAGIPLKEEIVNGAHVGSGGAWAYPVGFGGGTGAVNIQVENTLPGFYEWFILHEFAHTFRLDHSGLSDEIMGPISFGFPKYISKENADKLDKHRAFSVVPIIDELTMDAKNEEVNINADVNNDGYIDLYDVMIVRSGMRNSVSYDTDVNDDGMTNEEDLLIVKAKAIESIVAAAPRRIAVPYRDKRKVNLRTWGALKIRQ